MIEIFKAEHPAILKYIYEKLQYFEGVDPQHMLKKVLLQLATHPDETAIFVCFEDEKLMSFIFGFIADNPWAWLELGWSEATLNKQHKQEIMNKFCDWAASKGVKEMRMETKRTNIESWNKLLDNNFKEYAVILSKDI